MLHNKCSYQHLICKRSDWKMYCIWKIEYGSLATIYVITLILIDYSDPYWAGYVDDRRSTSGTTFFLGGCLVPWSSKKQSSASLSTAEAEYIAETTCCTHILWIKKTLQDIHVTCNEPIPILCDNTSAISISKNPVMHSKTKHIPIKFHFLRE